LALTGMDPPPAHGMDPQRVVLADVGLRHTPGRNAEVSRAKGGAATSNQ